MKSVNNSKMKLSEWAKLQGVTYKTAWRWVKAGKMPKNVRVEVMPTGTILVEALK